MGSYKDSIDKISNELLSFIRQYELSTEKGPIKDEVIKIIKDRFIEFSNVSLEHITNMSLDEKIFEDDFSKVMTDFRKSENEINNLLAFSMEDIAYRYNSMLDALKQEKIKAEAKCNREIDDLSTDVTFYRISSNQSEEVLERECDQNIKRFDYQIATAKDSYNQNIKAFNDKLEINVNRLTEEFDGKLNQFDDDTKKLIEKYYARIKKYEFEYSAVEAELNKERNEMKEKFRQESIALNQSVKQLIDEKNANIDELRNEYMNNLSNAAKEKDSRQKEYQSEMQQVLKDFVYRMNECDEKDNTLKAQNSENIDKEYRSFYYQLLEIKKRQNKELQKIFEDNSIDSNEELDRKAKAIIKQKNRNYHKLEIQATKARDEALKKINDSYQKDLEISRSERAILDLNKNYSVKKITDHEQSDNKYYQELNNAHEITMNSNIQIANLKYNQHANIVKNQSQIRNKELEKELDTIEATYQKQLEKTLTKISSIRLEVDNTEHLSVSLHEYEAKKYQKESNFLSISNLLEIEKCKILDNFNQRQYENNVLNSKTILAYGKSKLNLENEKFKALTDLKIEKLKALLAKDNLTNDYLSKEKVIRENEERNNVQRKTQYDIDIINHTVSYERFKGELKNLHKKLSVFVLLTKEVSNMVNEVSRIFTSTVNMLDESVEIIKIFFVDFFKIINSYIKNIINDLYEYELKISNSHHSFEESFKFRSYFTSLNSNFETQKKLLISKKNSLTETIDTYSRTVEQFNARIFSANNQIHIINERKGQKENIKEALAQNNRIITESRKKIIDITKLKLNLEHDVETLNEELRKAEDIYNSKLKDIQAMQRNSAFSYYDLEDSFKKNSKAFTSKIDTHFNIFSSKDYNIKSLAMAINDQLTFYLEDSQKILQRFYEIMTEFYNETKEAIVSDKKILLIKYNSDRLGIKNSADETCEAKKSEYLRKMALYDADIHAIDLKAIETERHYNELMKENDNKFEEDTQTILSNKSKSIERFYTEFYAMCDNLQEIINNHAIDLKNLNDEFTSSKIFFNKKGVEENIHLNQDLDEFIRAKDDLINHLPAALKFQTQQLILETKNINLALSEDIKLAKQKSNLDRKATQKKINGINLSLDQTLAENELLRQRDIIREKRNHFNKMKRIGK